MRKRINEKGGVFYEKSHSIESKRTYESSNRK